MKEVGILLPIFSLPSKYGIGDFGKEAYEFIDILSENGIAYWEILPIDSFDSSPFSPYSYYALEENYLSLDLLKEEHLLNDVETLPSTSKAVAGPFKYKYYQEAFSRFIPDRDYLVFQSDRNMQEYAEYCSKRFNKDKNYFLFLQYMLNKQWYALKKYANDKNVKIVGDMPAYPAFDSVEVKYHPECYQLKDGQMEFIAGAPPDFYNADGQSWGNPVYNYDYIKKNNYQYILDRYKDYLKRYDIIRIDYFKGLESFYKIPNGKTPREGIYEEGPRYELIDKLLEFSDKTRYWVENLGDITEDTLKLKNHYGLTGQNLTIFSVDYARGYDPSFKITNIIDYPCNHDTNTSIGWYEDLDPSYRERVREYLVNNECNSPYINDALMEYCFKSSARVVMIPIQEVIGLGPEARLNVPGVIADSNWSWKLLDFDAFRETIEIIKMYNK